MSKKPEFEVYDKLTDEVRETVNSKYAAKQRVAFWINKTGNRHHGVRPKKKEA